MIDKEKRREVAAKLRNTEIEDLSSYGHGYSAHLGEAIGQCVRLVSGHECLVEYGLNTLADLIEPKEYTREAEQDYDMMEDGIPDCRIWRCSCGEVFPYWRGSKPSFCTECGAFLRGERGIDD